MQRRYKPRAWTILLAVVLLGAVAYYFVFLSFAKYEQFLPILVRPGLVSNQPLNDYATTVAGLVGTAATVIGVAFLFYAYLDQRDQAAERLRQADERLAQEKEQQAQAQLALFNKLYQDLLDDINSIQYRKVHKTFQASASDSTLFQGVDALFHYEAQDDKTQSSVLNHLNLVLISFYSIIQLLERPQPEQPQIKDEARKIFLQKIYLLYLAKIYWPCYKLAHHYRRHLISNKWGYPRMLFYYLDYMTAKSHFFLIDKNLLLVEPQTKTINEILATPEEELEKVYKEHPDALSPELRSIMRCDYATIDTYWATQPTIPAKSSMYDETGRPKATMYTIVTKLFKESAFTDGIMAQLDQGLSKKLRDGFYWLRHAPKERSKYATPPPQSLASQSALTGKQ
jgi:hypothetical protein